MAAAFAHVDDARELHRVVAVELECGEWDCETILRRIDRTADDRPLNFRCWTPTVQMYILQYILYAKLTLAFH